MNACSDGASSRIRLLVLLVDRRVAEQAVGDPYEELEPRNV